MMMRMRMRMRLTMMWMICNIATNVSQSYGLTNDMHYVHKNYEIQHHYNYYE
jgi:hypothetical protein